MGNTSGSVSHAAPTGIQDGTVETFQDKSVESALCGQIPYKQRKHFIREIQRCLGKSDTKSPKRLNTNLNNLRCALGLESNDKLGCPDRYFILDECGLGQVQHMTSLITKRPENWQQDTDRICHQLLTHYGPPINIVPQDLPESSVRGLHRLSLVGIDLSRGSRLQILSTIIENNRELQNVELAFTNLDNSGMHTLFPALATLASLTYMGLRGNNLRAMLLDKFSESLQCKDNFRSLLWVDFTNNVDISILPDQFLETLRTRWPEVGYKPSFRDLAEGKAIVSEDIMDINV